MVARASLIRVFEIRNQAFEAIDATGVRGRDGSGTDMELDDLWGGVEAKVN